MAQVNDIHQVEQEQPDVRPTNEVSPLQPLRQPVFRMLWIATVVSNIGSWMNDVGVNWTAIRHDAPGATVPVLQSLAASGVIWKSPGKAPPSVLETVIGAAPVLLTVTVC